MLLFTEKRRGIDGYFVRMSRPDDIRRQIEQALPDYSAARGSVQIPASGDLSDTVTAQQLATAFTAFREKLPNSGKPDDPLFGYVSAERLNELVVSPPGPVVESPGETLGDEPLRTVLTAADRYVPTTNSAGRLSGLIDQDAVVLALARAAALARTAAK